MEFSPSLSRASVKSVSSQYSVEELQEKIGELQKAAHPKCGIFETFRLMEQLLSPNINNGTISNYYRVRNDNLKVA
ncbi:hypothetical protein CEXT_498161 [Caerostris extrusa]|uniref:Uncharacterized protein n=1 Tax=Caerostris extrusa TaxID=172846 RepID=A0AAV4NHS2_CAEEX|nr:hypothetical protein CEXT_498161 [Caerostris extrusa]